MAAPGPAGPQQQNPPPQNTSDSFPRFMIPTYPRQLAWLNRANVWPDRPANYTARNVIGGGGYGILARFTWTGGNPAPPVTDVVVKQAAQPRGTLGLKWESKLLRQVTAEVTPGTRRTEHIVKLYKGYHQDAGTGSHNTLDPLPFTNNAQGQPVWDPTREVGRIYLEFCSGGNLFAKIVEIEDNREVAAGPRPNPIPGGPPLPALPGNPPRWVDEEDLWRMFLCLAKAILVLETGSEDPRARIPPPPANPPPPNAPRVDGRRGARNNLDRNWVRIAHLDIKPDNILIETINDPDHGRLEVLRLADFGLSLGLPHVPLGQLATPAGRAWWQHACYRGTNRWMTPEQLRPKDDHGHFEWFHDFRDLNTWGIGAIMHALLTTRNVDIDVHWQHFAGHNTTNNPPRWQILQGRRFQAVGIDLFGGIQGIQIKPSPARAAQGFGPAPVDGWGLPNNATPLPYSKELIDLILRCLARDPIKRPSTRDLVTQIERVLATPWPNGYGAMPAVPGAPNPVHNIGNYPGPWAPRNRAITPAQYYGNPRFARVRPDASDIPQLRAQIPAAPATPLHPTQGNNQLLFADGTQQAVQRAPVAGDLTWPPINGPDYLP